MTSREAEERSAAALVAAGRRSADRVLRGGRVLNVHTGHISRADVAICGTRIAAVGEVSRTIGADTEIISWLAKRAELAVL